MATLTLHTLTVTQLSFSHSGQHLLAVSRDRGWSLWKLNPIDGKYSILTPGGHVLLRYMYYMYYVLPLTHTPYPPPHTHLTPPFPTHTHTHTHLHHPPPPPPHIHTGGLEVVLEARTDKNVRSHSRIIWACSWSADDSCFVTASRDKKVRSFPIEKYNFCFRNINTV